MKHFVFTIVCILGIKILAYLFIDKYNDYNNVYKEYKNYKDSIEYVIDKQEKEIIVLKDSTTKIDSIVSSHIYKDSIYDKQIKDIEKFYNKKLQDISNAEIESIVVDDKQQLEIKLERCESINTVLNKQVDNLRDGLIMSQNNNQLKDNIISKQDSLISNLKSYVDTANNTIEEQHKQIKKEKLKANVGIGVGILGIIIAIIS